MLNVSAESAERQAMDMLTLKSISAEREGMRDDERQSKTMQSIRVHGIVGQFRSSTTRSNSNDNGHSE